jgi:hypothetical protein
MYGTIKMRLHFIFFSRPTIYASSIPSAFTPSCVPCPSRRRLLLAPFITSFLPSSPHFEVDADFTYSCSTRSRNTSSAAPPPQTTSLGSKAMAFFISTRTTHAPPFLFDLSRASSYVTARVLDTTSAFITRARAPPLFLTRLVDSQRTRAPLTWPRGGVRAQWTNEPRVRAQTQLRVRGVAESGAGVQSRGLHEP